MSRLKLRTMLSAAALGLAFTATVAHAQLQLSGRVYGSFDDLGQANTTVTNSADGSYGLFASGIPHTAADTQSMVEFNGQSFTNIGEGLVASNLFTITNGVTLLGSTASTATFNLWVELTDPISNSQSLSALTFGIDNTPNNPDGSNPDIFSLNWTSINPIQVGNWSVQFMFNADPMLVVTEGSTALTGDLSVAFTPIPEPSTYAMAGALLLFGLIGVRRFRAKRAVQQS